MRFRPRQALPLASRRRENRSFQTRGQASSLRGPTELATARVLHAELASGGVARHLSYLLWLPSCPGVRLLPPAGHRRATGTVLQAVSCQIATCNGLFSFTFFRCISSFFESVTIDWVTSKYLSLVRYGAEQNRTSLRSRRIDQLVVGRQKRKR